MSDLILSKPKSLLEQAAAAGSTRAMVRLGQMQVGSPEGGVKRNDAAGFAMFKKAVDAGSPRGMMYLASCYKHGDGTAVDPAKAEALYSKAVTTAEAAIKTGKDDEALVTLGIAFDQGRGVKSDYAKAMDYFKKAADLGNREAWRRMGAMYRFGDGTPKDYNKALECYKKAFDMGDAAADFESAEMFLHWDFAGHADYAKNYLVQAGLWGYCPAMSEAGYLFMKGAGSGPKPEVPKNYTNAMRWFTEGSNLGDAACMNGLGLMIGSGFAGPVDQEKATAWYKASAEGGCDSGMYNLASVFEDKKDYAQALVWYRKAAEKDYPAARASLGMFYEHGTGVPRDYSQAMKWYLEAAADHDSSAMAGVGRLYAEGNGVPKDMKLAGQWMTKAADAGDPDAKKWIAEHGMK